MPDFQAELASAPLGQVNDIGTVNVANVLRTVLIEGPIARAEIASRIGLTRGTVTRAAAKLLARGLLVQNDAVPSPFGRPMVPLAIAGSSRLVATVHFGADEIRLGLVGIDGLMIREERIPYPTTEPSALVRSVAAELTGIISESSAGRHVLALGASIGGWVDAESGVVVNYRPLGWADVPLARILAEETGLPVFFDQMVRGMALAEMLFGSAKGSSDFVEVYVGNVLGATQVQDGQLRRGPRGAAGMISHLPVRGEDELCECGRRGCVQALASQPAIISSARAQGVLAPDQGMTDLLAITDVSAQARELVDAGARHLAAAVGAIIDMVNPAQLILVGVMPDDAGYLEVFTRALATASDRGDPVPVLVSDLGDAAPTVASAALFLEAFYRDPLRFDA